MFDESSALEAAIDDVLPAGLPVTSRDLVTTELFRSLPSPERGFAIEPEIAARVPGAGERIHEVPTSHRVRTSDAGKKLTAVVGLRVLWTLECCRVA